MLTLKEVRTILRMQGIRPIKRLGQNFLIDQNIQKKIIKAIDIQKEGFILEIGPGLGALTEQLCLRAKKVIAIEKDKRLYGFLLKNNSFRNLELMNGDILRYTFGFAAGKRLKVISNLPYYISSPILSHLINNRDFIDSIYVTVQREFAERIVARAGSKDYGSFSCFMQFYSEPTILFTIKKNAFYPTPEVDSCFLKIRVREKGLFLTDEEKLFKIIRACFEKRRKTILNSLYSSGLFASKQEVLGRLKDAGIPPESRPEEISLKGFVRIANIAH